MVATTTQLGDFARTIGGDRVDVHQILKPNTDPHDYEPRPHDVQDTANARLVFESGDELDAWMGKVVSQSGGSPQVVDIGAQVPIRRPGDPHWWHDPVNAQAAIVLIRNTLAAADPAHALLYDRNARAYDAKLRVLDTGIQRCLAQVPRRSRKLVTDHDAFGYFAGRYGIAVVGAVIPSQTTQAQASAKASRPGSAQTIRREHVKAVFPESSVNPKLAKAIARETGAALELHALRRHARAGRLAGRHVPDHGARERRRDGPRLHRRHARAARSRGYERHACPRSRARAGYAGGPPVLRDVSFALRTGERVGLLGPNGGGKTTLFRVLLGELRASDGRGHGRRAGGVACRRPSARAWTSP